MTNLPLFLGDGIFIAVKTEGKMVFSFKLTIMIMRKTRKTNWNTTANLLLSRTWGEEVVVMIEYECLKSAEKERKRRGQPKESDCEHRKSTKCHASSVVCCDIHNKMFHIEKYISLSIKPELDRKKLFLVSLLRSSRTSEVPFAFHERVPVRRFV